MSRRHADEHGAYVVAVFPKPCPGLCDHFTCRDVRYRATVRQLEAARTSAGTVPAPVPADPPVAAADAATHARPSGHFFATGSPAGLALEGTPRRRASRHRQLSLK